MTFQVKVPEVGESITEVTIGQWLKKDGDFVESDEVICEIESEKATLEITAEKSGSLKILKQEDETVPVGAVIAEIDTKVQGSKHDVSKNEEKAEPSESLAFEETKEEEIPEIKKAKISPVAAKILEEAGVAADEIKGSVTEGRITKSDALKAVAAHKKAELPAQPSQSVTEEKRIPVEKKKEDVVQPATKRQPAQRTERRERISTLRRTIAKHLVAAKNQTAMLTTFNEIDMGAVIEARTRYKQIFQEKYGVKLGFMSFFVKACSVALREFPVVNAAIDGDEIVYHDYCDISIAVSTPRGLVVPVIFNADLMNLAEIEREVARLAEKARDNKLTMDEMTGGTFSVTNGGVFGSLLSTPIINVPQSAVLGMHKIQQRPVAVNGEVVIRPMMYVALSYDHRLVDGKESVSFLVRVKELLEDPLRMLLEV
ncbi:MAG: 2-oxoglutarate dehydrogenase complex dihydrolipoyllysine-residue succinyltransferase [Calditrichaeota bacterium]|nr:2-oxoglutarate dehydrogenase complex dihydrolipoyllysine-residue succinyltransferase [Calditrichota bacterium]